MNDSLTEKIIGCAYEVHKILGFGFLEKVYENAIISEMQLIGLNIQGQVPLTVYYKNQIVGNYYADIIVEDKVIVELKSVQQILKEHEVQLVNYLKATDKDVGLLINFGKSVQIKRKYKNPL